MLVFKITIMTDDFPLHSVVVEIRGEVSSVGVASRGSTMASVGAELSNVNVVLAIANWLRAGDARIFWQV